MAGITGPAAQAFLLTLSVVFQIRDDCNLRRGPHGRLALDAIQVLPYVLGHFPRCLFRLLVSPVRPLAMLVYSPRCADNRALKSQQRFCTGSGATYLLIRHELFWLVPFRFASRRVVIILLPSIWLFVYLPCRCARRWHHARSWRWWIAVHIGDRRRRDVSVVGVARRNEGQARFLGHRPSVSVKRRPAGGALGDIQPMLSSAPFHLLTE
jgi:hypothetical protein